MVAPASSRAAPVKGGATATTPCAYCGRPDGTVHRSKCRARAAAEAQAAREANGYRNKPTVDDAMDALAQVLGYMPDQRDPDEDDTPGPIWQGDQLIEVVACVAECLLADPAAPCRCRCGDRNHGLIRRLRDGSPVVERKCGCGCGATVRRRFLPGHDARVHRGAP